MAGGGSKPGERRGGRKAGTPNKTTVTVKAALTAAYEKIGGDQTFAVWAKENQTDFYKLYTKLLPLQVANPEGETFRTDTTFNFIPVGRDDETD